MEFIVLITWTLIKLKLQFRKQTIALKVPNVQIFVLMSVRILLALSSDSKMLCVAKVKSNI